MLIFITLVSIVFTAVAALTAANLRAAKFSEHKIVATHLGEGLREWLYGEAEVNWEDFLRNTNNAICIPEEGYGWGNDGSCENYSTYDTFKREVNFVKNAEQVTATISISWLDFGKPQNIQVKAIYKQQE